MKQLPLPQDVAYLLQQLNQHGYEAYVVGGCVRDSLLGKTPGDWDITTSATPEEVKAVFSHTFDTGIQHGTVTVVYHHTNYEITTYRTETTYSDCRHPDSVCFTKSLEEDLKRRDFTMNAIAYHPKEGFFDFFGGREDIAAGKIRGVGDAAVRFQEDALRMLRGLRFSVQLGFVLEENTYLALCAEKARIKKISAERIRIELEKLLLGNYPEHMPLLWQSGLLAELFPHWSDTLSSCADRLIAQLKAAPKQADFRWALALQCLSSAEAKKIMEQLRFDHATLKGCLQFLSFFSQPLVQEAYEMRCLIGQTNLSRAAEILQFLAIAKDLDTSRAEEILQEIAANGDCCTLKELSVGGADLIQIGIPHGKALGEILQALLDDVRHFPSHNETKYLLQLASSLWQSREN